MTTMHEVKAELDRFDEVASVASPMLETARTMVEELRAQESPPAELQSIEAEFAALEAEIARLEQRQRDRRRLIGEAA